MLLLSINQPSKNALKIKPTTTSEKRYKKLLRNKFFKYCKRVNLRNSNKIKSKYISEEREYMRILNYSIKRANDCSSKHKKSKIMQLVEVPEERENLLDTKNILLKAKFSENYALLKHRKKIRNHFMIGPQSIDEALYTITFCA